jgi:hypothetical protein
MTDSTNPDDPSSALPPPPPGAETPTTEMAATPPPPPVAPPPPFEAAAEPAGLDEVGAAEPRRRRRWLLPTAIGIVALLVGVAIGSVGAQSTVKEKEDALAAMTMERDDYRSQVDDRQAQTDADTAAAQRIQAEKDEADRKAAADKAAADKAAADKAAADQAAADKAAADQAAAAAAAEAQKSTIPGSGIFAIGDDKNAGTYKTTGPAGGRSSCYYAVLSSPTSDSFDNIIDNNNIQGPGIVTLRAGQYFETNGCSEWTRS